MVKLVLVFLVIAVKDSRLKELEYAVARMQFVMKRLWIL